MRPTLVLTTLILLAVAVTGFAAGDEDGFMGVNKLRTAPGVTTYLENDKAQPRFVEGRLAEKVARGTEIAATYKFLDDNKAAFRMVDPRRELTVARMDIDDVGMRHVRMKQQYQGLPVIGGEMIAHFTSDDVLKTVNGNFVADLELEITPSLTTADATRLAELDLATFFGAGEPAAPVLVVFPWEETNYLAWRLFIYSDTPMGRWEYFVDARTGDIIYKANRIMDTDAIGTGTSVMGDTRSHIDTDYNGSTYRMLDYTRQAGNNPHGHDGQMPAGNYIQTNIAGSSLPGALATDADNVWDVTSSQSPAVDGHVYTSLVYDYLLHVLGRNGYDDNGASMLTIVNYSGDGDNNAYWDGSRIVIWSWSSGWRSLAGCPDVIAHEWGHAVTETTSGLVYQKEPGALNESFSDMIGAAFEWAHDTLDTPDWYMGENGQTTGSGFRSMSDPHQFGDPDTYGTGDPYWIDVENCTPSYYNDYCGVHTNSGVGNKWFFLISDGGTHNGITVSGIGVQNAMKVAYRANAFYWNSQSDYHEAALATMTAADDLDPSGVWSQRVSRAWNAVNVSTPTAGIAFDYPNGVPALVSPSAPTSFNVSITGVFGGQVDAGSGRLNYSIDGGAYVRPALTDLGADLYSAELPAVPCGSSIEFYLSVRMVGGTSVADPDGATPYSAIPADNINVALDDNFQTDLGWTVSGDAADGQWDRGVPVGGGDRGDPATDYDGSGACYLTDNLDDNTDVDDGTTILTSPVLDLSSGDAEVSYARWFSNNAGSAPSSDYMYVRISNDNGGSWTLVETVGPLIESSGGWYEHSFMAGDFVTPSSQVRVRFEVGDLGDGSVVEAGVDAFLVQHVSCDGGTASPNIESGILPDWTAGIAFSEQLNAGGGTGVLTWSDAYDDLVGTGLTLSATGLLEGTPVAAGTIGFTAHVVDEALATDDQYFEVLVNASVAVTAVTLPDWTAGMAYSQQLTATGGTGGMTWSDAYNDLVGTGLSVSAAGLLTGTPTVTGPISFTARAVDAVSAADEQLFSFTINAGIAVDDVTLPDWTAGVAYSQQVTASGGTGALTMSDKNGDLGGTGLALATDGVLTGIPTTVGPMNFTAMATDGIGATGERSFGFTVNAAVAFTTTDLPEGEEGAAYAQALSATGGTGGVTYSEVGSNLAAFGLTLSTEGVVSGVPSDSGTVTFSAEAADGVGSSDQIELSIRFAPAFICGDVAGDGEGPNVSDVTYIVNYLFASGPEPPILDAADVDASGAINVSDLTALVSFLFSNGAPLVCP